MAHSCIAPNPYGGSFPRLAFRLLPFLPGGKTRFWINVFLRLIRKGLKLAVLTTDNTGEVFYNRLIVIFAVWYMTISSPK